MVAHLLLQFGETVDPRPSPSTTSAFEFRDGARRTFCSCRGNNPVSLRFVAELNIGKLAQGLLQLRQKIVAIPWWRRWRGGQRLLCCSEHARSFPSERASPTIWTEGYPFQGCCPLIDIKATSIALLSSKAADGRLAWLDWPGLGAAWPPISRLLCARSIHDRLVPETGNRFASLQRRSSPFRLNNGSDDWKRGGMQI